MSQEKFWKAYQSERRNRRLEFTRSEIVIDRALARVEAWLESLLERIGW